MVLSQQIGAINLLLIYNRIYIYLYLFGHWQNGHTVTIV